MAASAEDYELRHQCEIWTDHICSMLSAMQRALEVSNIMSTLHIAYLHQV